MDVSELLRPLVDSAPPPPTVEHFKVRARRRRRGRVLARTTIAAVVLSAIVGIGLANRSDDAATKVVTASQPPPNAPTTALAGPTTTSTPLPAVALANRIAITRATPTFGPGLKTAEIVLVNSDGTDEAQLTHTADQGRVASQPAWSLDRRRLAFIESTPSGAINAGTGDIVIINTDGSNPVQLTTTGNASHPVWAPDGHHLAFARFDNGLPDVFVVGDDGSGLTQLTHGGAMSPTYSPDGTQLAYRNGVSDGGHIFIMEVDGTRARQLTTGLEEGGPAWSPDGTRIAFASTQDSSIYTIRFDGTQLARVTTCVSPSCFGDTAPAWSPDASQIVFDRSVGNLRQPYLVASTGGDAQPLVTDSNDDCCIAWS